MTISNDPIKSAPLISDEYRSGSFQPQIELFMHHFDGKQISDEQAAELIHKLWMIMSAFVDLGLGIHPAQNKFLPDISVGEDEQRYRLNLTDESKNK